MQNTFHTYVAYRDNNAWTSERGASKFLDLFLKKGSLGRGDNGCIINGMKVIANPEGADLSVVIQANDGKTLIKDGGHCVIKYSDYIYEGWQEIDYRLELQPTSQSVSRISSIVAYIDREIEYIESDKIVESPSVMKFIEIKGAEAYSPAPPTRTMIQDVVGNNNPYVILADILVRPNTLRITNSDITDRRIMALLSPDIQLDPNDSWATGFYQAAPNAGVKTRIVVTGPNASTPAAIPGVQLIWLRKKL